MRTFDACLPRGGFWAAVIIPPGTFLLIVQGWTNGIEHGELSVHSTLFIMALAQLLPFGALLWMLFSTASYRLAQANWSCIRWWRIENFRWEN